MLALGDFRRRWHHLAAGALRWSGALNVIRRVATRYSLSSPLVGSLPRLSAVGEPRILILCYHRIGTGGIPFYSELPRRRFEAQMRYLRKHYRILSLADAFGELQSPADSEPAVVVTFDDGYRDLFTQALPALHRYKIPATIYLTVGSIETGEVAWYDRIFLALKHAPGSSLVCELGDSLPRRFELPHASSRFHAAVEIITNLRTLSNQRRLELCADLEKQVQLPPDELAGRMLTWEQIRTMQKTGISFGCHTMTHPVVSQLTPSELETELVESKRVLEARIGCPVFDFAYPFGRPGECGAQTPPTLQQAGYRTAVTTSRGINIPGGTPYELRRVSCGDERSLAMFAVQLSWLFLRSALDETSAGFRDAPPVTPRGKRDAEQLLQ